MTADEIDTALAAGTLELLLGRRWEPVERKRSTKRYKRDPWKFEIGVICPGLYGGRTILIHENYPAKEIRDTRGNGSND